MKERSPAEVVRLVKDEGIEVVDLRFCDLPGSCSTSPSPRTC